MPLLYACHLGSFSEHLLIPFYFISSFKSECLGKLSSQPQSPDILSWAHVLIQNQFHQTFPWTIPCLPQSHPTHALICRSQQHCVCVGGGGFPFHLQLPDRGTEAQRGSLTELVNFKPGRGIHPHPVLCPEAEPSSDHKSRLPSSGQ